MRNARLISSARFLFAVVSNSPTGQTPLNVDLLERGCNKRCVSFAGTMLLSEPMLPAAKADLQKRFLAPRCVGIFRANKPLRESGLESSSGKRSAEQATGRSVGRSPVAACNSKLFRPNVL